MYVEINIFLPVLILPQEMTGNRMVRKILSAGCRVPNSPRVQVETKDYNDPHCEPEPIDAGLGALSASALAALAVCS
jgi:hypothetical protein